MTPESILLVKPSSLGDIVHTLPASRFIKRSFPQSRLYWVVNSEWSPVLKDNPDLAEVIPFPRRELDGLAGAARFWQWRRGLGALRPDLVLDFQGLLRSALIAWSSRGRMIMGLSDAREGARFFYRKVARVTPGEHAVSRYLALAALAGADVSGEIAFNLPAGRLVPGLTLPDRFIVLHPFARGAGKSLTGPEIHQLSDQLAPVPVVIVGRTDSPVSLADNAVSLVNQTDLEQLIWLLRQAAFVISVDSGPMHLAAAVSREILSIHFWSDPAKVGPFRDDAWIWQADRIFQRKDLPPPAQKIEPATRPDPRKIALFVQERLFTT